MVVQRYIYINEAIHDKIMNKSIEKKLRNTLSRFKLPDDFNCALVSNQKGIVKFSIANTYEIVVCVGIISNEFIGVSQFDELSEKYPTVSLFIWTNNTVTDFKTFRKSFDIYSYNQLRSNEIYSNNTQIDYSGNLKLVPLGDEFESILFEAHSHLRDIDGLHADSALDEICKIIFTKLYDEKNKKKLFRSSYSNVDECSSVIRALFNEAVLNQKQCLTKEQIGVFDQPLLLSSPALCKVVSEFESIDFSNSSVDIKGRAFQNMLSPALRSGMGQYFTPSQVIQLIVECISPKGNEKIIDPFCGSAHFLSESIGHVSKNNKDSFNLKGYVKSNIYGIDKSERMVRIGLTDILLMDGVVPNLVLSDSLLDLTSYRNIKKSAFDVVITNPPFGSVLGKDMFSSLGKFDLLKNKNSCPLEVLGLERSIQLLKKGGRLAIVLPDSIFLNKKLSYVREWLSENVLIKGVIGLPIETFSPFGASVKTSVLICVNKKAKSKYNIFMGEVNNIGYDASGKTIKGSDIDELANEFRCFVEKEGW